MLRSHIEERCEMLAGEPYTYYVTVYEDHLPESSPEVFNSTSEFGPTSNELVPAPVTAPVSTQTARPTRVLRPSLAEFVRSFFAAGPAPSHFTRRDADAYLATSAREFVAAVA